MRFVVVGDVHLDAPFAWAPPEAARRRRLALRATLERALGLADEVDADAVLSAGDLFEHERASADTAAFLAEAFGATSRPVLLAPGNHDWHGPASLYAWARWPGNVTVFTEDRLRPLPLAEGLTLWGAAHRAPANTGGFLDDGFTVDRGGVHLALFHGSERSGLRLEASGKLPHAPFDAAQIPAAGLHHAFVGHHHRPAAERWHTYPGNPDPLAFGEDGLRGAVVATVDADGTVRRAWHRVAVTEAHDVTVDVTGCASASAVQARVRESLTGREGVARVTLHGELDPDLDLRPGEDLTAGALGLATLDAVVVRQGDLAVAYDVTALSEEATVRGRFVREVLAAGLDEAERRRVLVTGLRALDGRDDLEAP